MAQQEGGWPLGLQSLNERIGHFRRFGFSRSLSFNSIINESSSFSSNSSDLDTESTGSFFHDRNIVTLGNLIGITSIIELPSTRSYRRNTQEEKLKFRNNHKCKTFFCLCSKPAHSGEVILVHNDNNNAPTLGHFLEAERRASNAIRNNNNNYDIAITYELGGLPENQLIIHSEPNSLFSDGLVVPPQHSSDHQHKSLVLAGDVNKSKKQFGCIDDESIVSRPSNNVMGIEKGLLFTLLFPCMVCHSSQNMS